MTLLECRLRHRAEEEMEFNRDNYPEDMTADKLVGVWRNLVADEILRTVEVMNPYTIRVGGTD